MKKREKGFETEGKTNEIKENIKNISQDTLESRVDDIQTDPEFEFRQRRLEKKLDSLEKDE